MNTNTVLCTVQSPAGTQPTWFISAAVQPTLDTDQIDDLFGVLLYCSTSLSGQFRDHSHVPLSLSIHESLIRFTNHATTDAQ
jgi:hypothetical protein